MGDDKFSESKEEICRNINGPLGSSLRYFFRKVAIVPFLYVYWWSKWENSNDAGSGHLRVLFCGEGGLQELSLDAKRSSIAGMEKGEYNITMEFSPWRRVSSITEKAHLAVEADARTVVYDCADVFLDHGDPISLLSPPSVGKAGFRVSNGKPGKGYSAIGDFIGDVIATFALNKK
jgi:hypothetical protein